MFPPLAAYIHWSADGNEKFNFVSLFNFSINDVITELKTNNWVQTVLWLWNWSTVYDAADIITQFFLLDNKKSLKEADSTSVKNALSSYFKFWDINWENWYNYFLEDLKSNSKNNLTKNDTKSLSKPENPFSVEWKENQYNRLNLQIDIHSLTDITVNNVIVNNGKCETDIWNPAGAHKGELKGKFPKYLEQYDVLEILVWNCKKMHRIEIETNYGSYFYNIK